MTNTNNPGNLSPAEGTLVVRINEINNNPTGNRFPFTISGPNNGNYWPLTGQGANGAVTFWADQNFLQK
ncbi:hypothetical protein [Ekhidna sp. To15]|uniref:hypothetical protein n=1 Tax=Ekhidna sp. To15 TaxID=3395267 RepID=UPI003F52008C